MSGEVVLVKKEEVPVIGVPPTTLDKTVRAKEKKPLTERQKANLEKLIALNKQKARERKGILEKMPAPEEIPDGYVALPIAPKRKYTRRAPSTPMAPVEEDEPQWAAPPVKAVPRNLPKENPKLTRQNAYHREQESESEEDEPSPVKKPVRKPAKKPVRKPVRKPNYTTEETTDYSDESDSDDDEKVQKYVFKAQKRIAEAKAIEEQMNRLKNPYAARGFSIF